MLFDVYYIVALTNEQEAVGRCSFRVHDVCADVHSGVCRAPFWEPSTRRSLLIYRRGCSRTSDKPPKDVFDAIYRIFLTLFMGVRCYL